jgi:hypothetical protein
LQNYGIVERIANRTYGGMRINDEPVFFIPPDPRPPAFNRAHTYTFRYYVGEDPHQVAFSIQDEDRSDNTGQFVIEVSTQPLYRER